MRRKYTVEDHHPVLEQKCPACQVQFRPGDQITHVEIGPGNDPDEMRKAANNQPYNAVAVIAHWSCVTGEGHASATGTPPEILDENDNSGEMVS